jgi:hypothetical protein
MRQLESIGRPQPDTGSPATPRADAFPLTLDARYSVNTRALRKWAQERLQLEIAADGSVSAQFRYEGTTCSNFGRPIHSDYHVRLDSVSRGYRIAEVRYGPASGDSGYTLMCEYLKDPDAFTSLVASEKPLLGRPLDDVLTWARSSNPAGCQCDAGSREHKWGLVFEVIHFALAQQHRAKMVGQTAATISNS